MVNLKPGTYLQDGSIVEALIEFRTSDKFIYVIDDVEVTKDHLIRYNDKWIRVKKIIQKNY